MVNLSLAANTFAGIVIVPVARMSAPRSPMTAVPDVPVEDVENERSRSTKAVVARVVSASFSAWVTPVEVVFAEIVPEIVPDADEMFPVTARDDSVPTDVILGCAAVVRVPETFPDTANEDNVPTDVMFGCAAVNNVPVMLVADNEVRPVIDPPVPVPTTIVAAVPEGAAPTPSELTW